MNQPRVTIGLVLFTGCEKYLKYSLRSLMEQDYPETEFLIRDQSPGEAISRWVRQNHPDLLAKAAVSAGENLMHSGGHNALIGQALGDYYICASGDMLYPANLVSRVVAAMEKKENAAFGSATVKLMQWDFKNRELGNRIDSCGIGLGHTHHFFDIGQGEEDRGQYDHSRPFGPSGALGIYRLRALRDVACGGEYFDERLHYKNDADLAYRLQWAGYGCLMIPEVKVYHDRQVSGKKGFFKSRLDKSRWEKENSFFGHLVTLQKNYDRGFSSLTRLSTFLYNMLKFFFIFFFEPHLLKQYAAVKQCAAGTEQRKKAQKKQVAPSAIELLMS